MGNTDHRCLSEARSVPRSRTESPKGYDDDIKKASEAAAVSVCGCSGPPDAKAKPQCESQICTLVQ